MFKKLAIAAAITTVLMPMDTNAELTTTASVQQKKFNSNQTLTKRFIVKLKSKKPINANQSNTQKTNPIISAGKSKINFHRKLASGDLLIEAGEFSTMASLLNDLTASGEVLSIEEDDIVYAQSLPNDYYAASMYSIENSLRGINAIAAWELSQGKGVNVAIIDTGFTDHPDYNERSINGYDMISYQSHALDGDLRDADAHDPGTGIECENRNSSWHGTHVAGIIGASKDNTIGAVGIAPLANLVHIRALGKCSSGYRSDIVDAIYWASGKVINDIPVNSNPVKVINLSLGSNSACGSYQSAIDYARTQGVTVVVSAGNNNTDAAQQAPANCTGVIAVAATTNNGDKASYSNYSPFNGTVDIAAPGSSIISTLNLGTKEPSSSHYGTKSGTSMAAPQVVGVVALMLEKNPTLSPDEIEQIIKDTADQFPSFTSCNTQGPICGYGLINAEAAVLKAMAMAVPAPIVLVNKEAITISAKENDELSFSFSVPEEADQVTFKMSRGTGDADIYVKKAQQATIDNYDCRPWKTGNDEKCTIQGDGDYSIMVRGYNAFDNVNLVASYQTLAPVEGIELTNNDVQWELSGEYHEELLFWADVPENTSGLWIQTWGGTGDADLWVKRGGIPTAQNNDCLQSHSGNEETCTMENIAGRYYIKVRGYDVFDRVALRIIWNN